MKRICFVILFLWCYSSFSQNTFLESFYTAGIAQNMFGKKTSDSGYLLYGFNSFTGNNLLTKTDSDGIVVFSKYYNLPIDYLVYDAFESQNGYTLISTGLNNSICLIKTDQNGMFISGKSYYSPQGAVSLKWLGQIGSDIYLCGRIGNSSALVKTDSTGTILWSKSYNAYDFGSGVISQHNELYIIGYHQGFNAPATFKLDSAGNSIWNVQFGGAWIDLTENSGVILGRGISAIKLDSLGTFEWGKNYYASDTANHILMRGIKTAKDNGYIMAGTYEPNNNYYPAPVFLMHIDQQGTANWSKTYGSTNEQEVGSCESASDSGYVVVGTTYGFSGTTTNHCFIFKTDISGNLGCYDTPISITDSAFTYSPTTFTLTYSSVVINDSLFIPVPVVTNQPNSFICSSTTNITQPKKLQCQLFPNPVDDNTKIVVSENKIFKFIAYDIFGKVIFEREISSLETEIEFSKIPNGIYFYQLSNSENNFTGKFIVAH